MSSIVYKACENSVITLELLSDSRTNEERYVVNPAYAKFRTNKAKVLLIANPETGEEMDQDRSHYDSEFIYNAGKTIETDFDSDFDNDINSVCGKGIHYYKTVEGALSWYYRYHLKTNGTYTEYYADGKNIMSLITKMVS